MKKIFLLTIFFVLIYSCLKAEDSSALFKGVHKMILDNGLTVLIKEDHSLPVAAVQVWVKVGSVNENKKTHGLSHFLEHLIFKGSEKYPAQEISKKVETKGGIINAGTSKEFTNFYIETQKNGFEEAVKILADTMANAVFPQEEIEKERPVVIEEIYRHSDNPSSVLYDLFSEAVFTKTPYRESIIGSSTVIKNVTRQEISNYYHKYYVPGNMVVSIVGDINKTDAITLVQQTFGKQKSMPVPEEPKLIEPEHKSAAISKQKNVEHAYWMGGFLGPDISSDDQFAADITSVILGGGRSSRLYRRLREEKQLVYSTGASFWSQRGSGISVISAVFDPGKKKAVLNEITNELNLLMTNGPSDAEIQRAKEMTKSQWAFGLETFHEQASLIGYWEMQKRPEMTDIYISCIEKITKEDVVNFLKKYYQPHGLSSAVLLPKKSGKK